MDEATITITKAELETALREWDRRASEEGWPDRADDERFADNADLLFEILTK